MILPDESLTQHSCFFVSSGLTPLASGLGACVTVKRYTTTACKIHLNSPLSPEQLVSAPMWLAGWLENSWLPFVKPYAPSFAEDLCFTSSLLRACYSSFAWITFIPSLSQEAGERLPPTTLVHWGWKQVRRSGWEGGKKVGKGNDRNPPSTCQRRVVLSPEQLWMSSKTQGL